MNNQSKSGKYRFDEIFGCSLPVLSDCEIGDYNAYVIGGTCILARYQNDLFVITAKHVIDKQHNDPHKIEVIDHQGGVNFLPLASIIVPEKIDMHDSDYADLAIFKVDETKLQIDSRQDIRPLNLDLFDLRNPTIKAEFDSLGPHENKFFYAHSLAAMGYPKCSSEVNSELHKVFTRRYYVEADYIGTGISKHCHELKFKNLDEISGLNGMSGSPVYHYHTIPTDSSTFKYGFAGMLIRGCKESKMGIFIDFRVIYSALDEVKRMDYERRSK